MEKTIASYDRIVNQCKTVFKKKITDYGASWRTMRMPSITDQIYMKALRIVNIQQLGKQKVADSIWEDYMGIYNYCIIAIIQNNIGVSYESETDKTEITTLFHTICDEIKHLMERKNHDYGEVWRTFRTTTFIDLILQKIHRIKQIENNEGQTKASEGVVANYQDIANYAIFWLILNTVDN